MRTDEMLDIQNIQVPADFKCPMQGKFYVTRGGWCTNVRGYAETTWFDVPADEVMGYRQLVSTRLSRMLVCMSASTLAEGFGLETRTVVRMARWTEQSLYRPAPWLVVRAAFEELFEQTIQ